MTMHDSAQALRGKKLLLVGFTLFSMFFGAGNLIFPPFLGAQAGTALWLAFVGFAVSAIGLPIAGVAAVARAGGLPALAGRVHPRFAQVFAVLVYLSIGPCLAIPRTASTSFEMLTPLVGRSTPGQFIYSLVFFAAAYFVALKPEKLTQRLGRILYGVMVGAFTMGFRYFGVYETGVCFAILAVNSISGWLDRTEVRLHELIKSGRYFKEKKTGKGDAE